MGGQDEMSRYGVRPAFDRSKIVQAVPVNDQGKVTLADEGLGDRAQGGAGAYAGTEGEHVVVFGGVEYGIGGLCADSAGGVFGQADSGVTRVNGSDDAQGACGGCDTDKTGAGFQRGSACQGCGTAHSDTAGDDAHAAEGSLVAVNGSGL